MLMQRPVSWRPALGQAPGAPAPAATQAPAPIPSPSPAPALPAELVMFGSGAGLGALAGAIMAAIVPGPKPKWIGFSILSLGGLLGIAAGIPGLGVSDAMRERGAFLGGGAAAYGAVQLATSSKKA